MLSLLLKVLSLDFASLFSPVMLAISILLMSSKFHFIKKTLFFILGNIVIGIGIITLGYFAGETITDKTKPTFASSLFDLGLGLLLLIYAIKTFLGRNKDKPKKVENEDPRFIKLLATGVLVGLSNIDGLILSFTNAKTISEANVPFLFTLILLFSILFFLTLPATLPLILYYFFPKKSEFVLSKIHNFLIKYGPFIVSAVFALFGILLIYKASGHFT